MGTPEILAGSAVPEPLRQSLAELLWQRLEPTGVADVAIYPDVDHDGDPVVRVQIKHRLVDRPIQFRQVFEAERAARDLAWHQGERRFVLIDHTWDEKQKVAGAR